MGGSTGSPTVVGLGGIASGKKSIKNLGQNQSGIIEFDDWRRLTNLWFMVFYMKILITGVHGFVGSNLVE